MKKTWNTPQLTVYGAVEKLTQGSGSVTLFADGFIFGGSGGDDDDSPGSSL